MTIEDVKALIRDVYDFPKEGIVFKDLTTIFNDAESLRFVSDELYERYKDKGITKIVGIESRGFIFGAILAARLGIGFVPIRKKGKLPAKTIEESYAMEYGFNTIEVHEDALSPDDVVLIHDDLLATGGTAMSACKLMKKMNVKKIFVNFIAELDFLKGRKMFDDSIEINTLIHF
jgi:adenine phosphoribosyltransferase